MVLEAKSPTDAERRFDAAMPGYRSTIVSIEPISSYDYSALHDAYSFEQAYDPSIYGKKYPYVGTTLLGIRRK